MIDLRTEEEKKQRALELIQQNVKKKHPHYSNELCRGIAKNILESK